MPMRGLTVVVVEASTARLHGALSIAAASAATGAPTKLHLHGEAAAMIVSPVGAAEDERHAAAGLPTLAQLLDETLDLGVAISACQSGLAAAAAADAGALDPRVTAGGLVGVMAALREDRLVVV